MGFSCICIVSISLLVDPMYKCKIEYRVNPARSLSAVAPYHFSADIFQGVDVQVTLDKTNVSPSGTHTLLKKQWRTVDSHRQLL